MAMNILILVRGISGSGKTFYVNKYHFYTEKFEADDWFIDENHHYSFDSEELNNAHSYCRINTEYAMRQNKQVVVSNTFTRMWELKPYLELALKYNYIVKIVETDTPWRYNAEECANRNIHNVPIETIRKQLQRFEKIDVGTYNTDQIKELLNNG